MKESKGEVQVSKSKNNQRSSQREPHELDVDMSRADWLADIEEAVTAKTPDPLEAHPDSNTKPDG
jgi:hypothetical protein